MNAPGATVDTCRGCGSHQELLRYSGSWRRAGDGGDRRVSGRTRFVCEAPTPVKQRRSGPLRRRRVRVVLLLLLLLVLLLQLLLLLLRLLWLLLQLLGLLLLLRLLLLLLLLCLLLLLLLLQDRTGGRRWGWGRGRVYA